MSVLFLGPIYPEKVFSVGVGKNSRNSIPHQIEPSYKYKDYEPNEIDWSNWNSDQISTGKMHPSLPYQKESSYV